MMKWLVDALLWCALCCALCSTPQCMGSHGHPSKVEEGEVDLREVHHPLWTAASLGLTEEVGKLLVDGADVDERVSDGRTTLHIAATLGYEAVALLLLEHGAEVSAQDNQGGTPLSCAVWEGREAVGLLLLYHGANIQEFTDLDAATEEAGEGRGRQLVAKARSNPQPSTLDPRPSTLDPRP